MKVLRPCLQENLLPAYPLSVYRRLRFCKRRRLWKVRALALLRKTDNTTVHVSPKGGGAAQCERDPLSRPGQTVCCFSGCCGGSSARGTGAVAQVQGTPEDANRPHPKFSVLKDRHLDKVGEPPALLRSAGRCHHSGNPEGRGKSTGQAQRQSK